MKVTEITLSCAFRYALGSMTYVVSDVVEDILDNWNIINRSTKLRFVKEIREYRKIHGFCGMEMDDTQWQKVVDKLESTK